jgi:hypothetical protein
VTDMALLAEPVVRTDLARLLLASVEASGRARCDIARDAQIHKDALRRVLTGERSASLGETLRILAASGAPPHAHFFEELTGELPAALERVLSNQINGLRPRWAKGTAHRVARLLSDHIDELERRDALLGDTFASHGGSHG